MTGPRDAAAYLVAVLLPLALLTGCGGIGPTVTPQPTAAIVVVEALDATSKDPLTVDATAVCAGVRGDITVTEGSVVLRNVPFGTGTPPTQPLTVTAPGYVTFAEVIQISVTQVTFYSAELETADPATTGTVTGTIRDSATQAPLTSALVKFVHTSASGSTEVRGYTDAQGQYRLGGVNIGQNQVTVEAPGYVTAAAQMNVAQDEGGGTNLPLNLDLLAGSTAIVVAGTVFDVFNQAPLEGAQVTLGSRPTVSSATNGEFSITDVPVGSQTLTVTCTGYDDYVVQIDVLPGMARLRVGMTPSAPQPPPGPYNLQGTVTLNGAADNSGALVTAVEVASARELGRVTTPVSGLYTMFLPPSEYRLTVAFGGRTVRRTVTIPSGGRVLTGVDFVLTVP